MAATAAFVTPPEAVAITLSAHFLGIIASKARAARNAPPSRRLRPRCHGCDQPIQRRDWGSETGLDRLTRENDVVRSPDSSVIRSAIFAAACLISGVASAEPSWIKPTSWAAQYAGETPEIGAEPWTVDGSAAFGADDAYVFADVSRVSRLDAVAVAAAVSIDQERLLGRADASAAIGATSRREGRISAAYDRFVALGETGSAYASRGFARDDATASGDRIARAPMMTPSIVATILPGR